MGLGFRVTGNAEEYTGYIAMYSLAKVLVQGDIGKDFSAEGLCTF